jgi:Holliday junction resolvase RusA-like endonuclease
VIAFRVRCIPPTTTHQHKRIVRVGKWTRLADRPELQAAKDMLDGLILPFQPAEPLAGAVALTLEFVWPWRASESKRNRAAGRIAHTSRPDCSNLAKTIEDRLVALRFLEDDNAVAKLTVTKWWSADPGIAVTIGPVTVEPVRCPFDGNPVPCPHHGGVRWR